MIYPFLKNIFIPTDISIPNNISISNDIPNITILKEQFISDDISILVLEGLKLRLELGLGV